MTTFKNFINGEYVEAADGRTTPVVNPATGEEYGTAALSGEADIDAAMRAAEQGFETWRDSTPSERSLALFRIADAIEARADELIAREVENTGKPAHLTRSEEIPPMVDQVRFFATAARHLEGKAAGEYMKGMTSIIRREPIGVCAQVAPWNYPMMMAVWKFAPALAAGNAVVLKPSDTTPATTGLLAEIAAEFLPKGVFNVICGDRDTGRAMVAHDAPAMVSVTGSVRAGMEVASAAACATSMPARTLPVIATICGTACETRARPLSRSPQTTLKTPGGRNSAAISARSRVDAGVVSDGLSTVVLPAAIAGANFHTAIIIG